MDRRESLKLLALAAVSPGLLHRGALSAQRPAFLSDWSSWPDMRWVGPGFWGNRLQDWELQSGVVVCRTKAPNRTLHCLTHRATSADFTTTVHLDRWATDVAGELVSTVGVRLGATGRLPDFRSAAVHGEGLDVGIGTDGVLFVGDQRGTSAIEHDGPLSLTVQVRPVGRRASVIASVRRLNGAEVLSTLRRDGVGVDQVAGGLALWCHTPDEGGEGSAAAFSAWSIDGAGIEEDAERVFGPVMFAQYTVHRGTLKLTAQLAPVDATNPRVELQLRRGGAWVTVDSSTADPLSRTAHFRVERWERSGPVPYRVVLRLETRDGGRTFEYSGTIAEEPAPDEPLKVAVFSCNADHGFPDSEVVEHVSLHRPDACLFLGDQFYEGSGGFGIQTDSVPEASLDVLHKWYMFGWSYRDLFRDVPAAIIPDDHDVYHGNVWGEGGKVAPTDEGWGAPAQDQGGYKMPAEWVRAVERAQTSHLPDAVDPEPVEQGIGVYFTTWDYGGVSFAIIEDRKFKSAPKNVLPQEAQVWNGWIQNPEFDIREHRDVPGAVLLGERQMRFLRSWAEDFSGAARVKVLLSQTNFAAVHTIPEDATSGAVLPGLPMPRAGQYVEGDKLAVDMDSNGWPGSERDEVLRILRRCAAFHIAGDQHLATVVRHGVDEFDDAGFSFTGPALNNIWPRRWWPPRTAIERELPDAPPYAGSLRDGFGNRITVHAAANPRATGLEPAILRDRVTGYGIVTFDKGREQITIECWPRHVNPVMNPDGQYADWPVVVALQDGDGRTPSGPLQSIEVTGLTHPVVEVRGEAGNLVSTRRLTNTRVRLPRFAAAPHVVRVGDPDRRVWQERTIDNDEWGRRSLRFSFQAAEDPA